MAKNDTQDLKRLYGDVREVAARYGWQKTKTYELLRDKKIRAKKLGTKTLIEFESVDEYVASLPAYGEA